MLYLDFLIEILMLHCLVVNVAMKLTPLILLSLCLKLSTECPSLNLSQQVEVSDECSSGNCTLLTDALADLNSSTLLYLANGTHHLTSYVPVNNLQGIAIQGSSKDVVTIRCAEGIGLSFVNIVRLTLCGVTFLQCGLTGPDANITSQLEEHVGLQFMMPVEVRYGLVIANCWDLSLQDVNVTKTRGLGLLGINIMGVSVFEQVGFTYNIRPSCSPAVRRYPFKLDKKVYEQIGGGAYFLYQDYETNSTDGELASMSKHRLSISDSHFGRNAECSYAGVTQVNAQKFPTNCYVIGGGGGLSIYMAQSMFSVDAAVTHSSFIGNDARYGAGAHIGLFTELQMGNVSFVECLFEGNGAAVREGDTLVASEVIGGAGLAIFTDLVSPSGIFKPITVPSRNNTIRIVIANTSFINNEASVEGGGLLLYSLFNTPHRTLSPFLGGFYTLNVLLTNCSFDKNSAQYGAAAYALQNSVSGIEGTLQLLLYNVRFTNSITQATSNNFVVENNEFYRVRSAVALHKMYLAIFGRVECSGNSLTGLLIESSSVVLAPLSQFLVERNTGLLGGGIHLTGPGSFIAVARNATLVLQDNTATLLGGAIYVSESVVSSDLLRPVDQVSGCFISPIPFTSCFLEECFNITKSNISIVFSGNTAPRGSVVYGSTWSTCTWTQQYLSTDSSIFQTLYDEVDEVEIDLQPNSSSVVSTQPANITVSLEDRQLEIFPGETVELQVDVRDQFGNRVPGTLTSYVNSDDTAVLDGGRLIFTNNGTNVATLEAHAPEGEQFGVFVTELVSFVSTNLTITTKNCRQGYSFDEDTMSCECNKSLVGEGIKCNMKDFSLVSPDRIWVGSISDSNATEDLAVGYCQQVLEYCASGDKPFVPPNYDAQCSEDSHRTGVLCGQCAPTYSEILGVRDSRCRKCSNFYLFLVPVYGFLGVLFFLLVAFLEVTVEKGWMYSILLYSNLILLSALPLFTSSLWESVFFTPAYLLSFEVGIGICLFDGMTALIATFIRFTYPVFMYLVMGIFALLSRKVTLNISFTKTFETLGMMCYTSVLISCLQSMVFATLTTVRGETQIRWGLDANLHYFRGWHIPLFLLGLVLLIIYIIPVPLLLLFPQFAYKITRAAPFLDPLWASFKPKWRFWLGVRLLLRVVLFFIRATTQPVVGTFMNSLILLGFVEIQLIGQPFKEKWVNALDNVLIGSVIALNIGLLFLEADMQGYAPFFHLIIAFGYCLVFGVIFYHLSVKFKLRQKSRKYYAELKARFSRMPRRVTMTEVSLNGAVPAGDDISMDRNTAIEQRVRTIRNHNPTRMSFGMTSRQSSLQSSPSISQDKTLPSGQSSRVQSPPPPLSQRMSNYSPPPSSIPVSSRPLAKADFSKLRESLLASDSV